jgi:phosphoglycerol transferase
MKKTIRNIGFFIVFYLWVLWFYTKEFFGKITAEQILFHIQWVEGNFEFDIGIIRWLFIESFVVAYVSFVVIYVIYRALSRKIKYLRNFKKISYVPFIMFIILICVVCNEIKIWDLVNFNNDDFIKDNYVKPVVVKSQKIKQKNLVLIYVESLEKTYGSKLIFGENLLQSLDDLPGFEFQNYIQTPNTEWTMAAIVGSQCGIPLKSTVIAKEPMNAVGVFSKQFLPAAICLGDVLKQAGYYNEYMQGATLAFAGKGKFLKSHGYHNIRGRQEWLATKYTADDMSEWGLYDDLLMQEAKITLDSLVKSKKLFNLTILTLDTHFPDGYFSKTCKNAGGKNFQDIIKCSNNEVANFIQYIIDKGYLEHTNIVILGDHLTLPNTIFDLVEKEPKRSIYNKWITKDNFEANRQEITHFDIAPTILSFIGLKVLQGRFGLGYSAVGKNINNYNPGLIDDYCTHLNKQSSFYNDLWKASAENNKDSK